MDENPYEPPPGESFRRRKRTVRGFLISAVTGSIVGWIIAQVIGAMSPAIGSADTGDAAVGGLAGLAIYLVFGGRRESPPSNS